MSESATSPQAAVAAVLGEFLTALAAHPRAAPVAVLYEGLAAGEVPAALRDALRNCLASLTELMPGDQIECLTLLHAVSSAPLHKVILLRAALARVAGATVWLHHDAAFYLSGLLEAGVAEAAAPALLHATLMLEQAGPENPGVPFMRHLLARLAQNFAPREAIFNGAIALRLGQSDAMAVIRNAATRLKVLPREEDSLARISGLRMIEQSCGLPSSSVYQITSAAGGAVRSGEVVAAAETAVPAPHLDAFYYLFSKAGAVEKVPAISVHALEGGIISFDLTRLGQTQFYVFDRNRVCIEDLSWGAEPFIAAELLEEAGDLGVIGDRFCGPMNVCHFLLDHLTRVAVYDRFTAGTPKILLSESHAHYLAIIERAGLAARILCPGVKRFSVRAGRLLVASNLIRDLRHPAHHGARWAVAFIRDLLAVQEAKPTRRLFISRADTKGRNVINGAEIEAVMLARGFEIINLSALSLEDQIAAFAAAEIVVGVHGAGLTNAVFSRPGLKLLEILPPLVATPAYWILCHGAGHHYIAMVADDPELARPDYTKWEHHPEYNLRDIVVNPARLAGVLDQLIAAGPVPPPAPARAETSLRRAQVNNAKRNVAVIANCHCLPLADALTLVARKADADFIDVTFAEQPHMLAKIDKLFSPDAAEVVFSFNLSEHFGRIATTALRPVLGQRMITFTNIHFAGLHPDITYLGPMGQRINGFFGDYHSKLVLFCFAQGRSAAQCLALFNGATYERVGFFQSYAAAAAELLQRDGACDVKFAASFLEMLRERPCLYTLNHPTGAVFLELAKRLAAAADFQVADFGPAFFQNHLSVNYVWPVYDEIAEHHRLAYRGPFYFLRPTDRAARAATLEEFIAGCYEAYARAEFNEFAAMVRALPFFKSFSERL